MEELTVRGKRNFVRSLVGKDSKMLSSSGMVSKCERLIVGENTMIHRWLGGDHLLTPSKWLQDMIRWRDGHQPMPLLPSAMDSRERTESEGGNGKSST